MEKQLCINLNSYVKVKLTDLGTEMFKAHARNMNEYLKSINAYVRIPQDPELDENGYYVNQMWYMMHIFGPFMENMALFPFEDGDIIIGEIEVGGGGGE
jgi:hypothetical protein